MTQTALVAPPFRPLLSRYWLWVVALLLLGCDQIRGGKEQGASDFDLGEEQSPSARIFPEPLEDGATATQETGLLMSADGTRPPPRPWPMSAPIGDDDLKRGVGPGFEMRFQIELTQAQKSQRVGESEKPTWPVMRVQLLPESSDRQARMRWILEGAGFPFPSGTEIRTRADRVGHLILWPDRRSYRIVPSGSLHSTFADRRVDRLPFVELEIKGETTGTRLGKPTRNVNLETPLGTAIMEFVEVKELNYAAPLLCASLLELIRVKANPEVCKEEQLPVHLEVNWAEGGELVLSVRSWGAVTDQPLDDYRTPPDLPIFKLGELPPFDEYFFGEKERFSMLPLTKEKEPPLPSPPASSPAPSPGAAPRAIAPAEPGPPRNQLTLVNTLNRPLVVFLNKTSFVWLRPKTELAVYLKSSDIQVSARSFFGDLVFAEQTILTPGIARFGVQKPAAETPRETAAP